MVDIKQVERESSKIKFKVLLSKDEVEKAYSKTISTLAKDIKVPGFRKGKVPHNIIRMQLGKERLASEVIDTIFSDIYTQAKKELDFIPVGYPQITDLDLEEGKESYFEVKVDIQPDIKIPEFSEIEVEKLKIKVDEEEVEDAILELRKSMSTLEPIENGEIKGEENEVAFVKIDIDTHDESLNEKYKDLFHKEEVPIYFDIKEQEGLDKKITESLKGKKVGDEISFTYKFPDDFYIEDLKNKEIDVKIKIIDIKKRVIPLPDDDFAKELGYDDFVKLKEDVYNRLLKEKQEREEIRFENEIIKRLLEKVDFEPPEGYIEKRSESLKKDLIEDLKKRNLTLAEYLENNGISEEALDNYYREEAKTQLKISMLLDAIEEESKIKVEEKDIEKELEKFASSYRISTSKAKELYEKDEDVKSYIDYKVRRSKVMEFIKNSVKVKEVEELKEEESGNKNDE